MNGASRDRLPVESPTRRRLLCLCTGGLVAGLAGCTGTSDDDGGDDTAVDDGPQTSDESDEHADTVENTATDGTTIGDNTQTGRYTFEMFIDEDGGDYTEDDGIDVESVIWDVQSLDGDEATVEITVIREDGSEGTQTITASTDHTEVEDFGVHYVGDGYDIMEIAGPFFGNRWLPIHRIGSLDLSTLAVGETFDASGPGGGVEVTGTDSHAGIGCYVVEYQISGYTQSTYCVSPEHAMVIGQQDAGADTYVRLVDYEP